MQQKSKTENLKDHPLEEFFNLDPGTTEITKLERSTELVKPETYDDKDNEVEASFQEIYDKAITAYDRIQDDILDDVEPRYAARIIEVATTTLNVALEAAGKRAKLKEHKDKLQFAKDKSSVPPVPRTLNQAVIVSNTADLIKTLKNEMSETPIDTDFVEVDKENNNDTSF